MTRINIVIGLLLGTLTATTLSTSVAFGGPLVVMSSLITWLAFLDLVRGSCHRRNLWIAAGVTTYGTLRIVGYLQTLNIDQSQWMNTVQAGQRVPGYGPIIGVVVIWLSLISLYHIARRRSLAWIGA